MNKLEDDPRFDAPLFRDIGTFMGVPASRELTHAKAAIVGIPFDCGLHPVRLGARLGPAEIRRQSSLVRRYQPPLWQVNLLAELAVVDCGDVNVVLGDIVESYRRIEAALDVLFDARRRSGHLRRRRRGDAAPASRRAPPASGVGGAALRRAHRHLCRQLRRRPGRLELQALQPPPPPSPGPPRRASSTPPTRCTSDRAAP